MELLLFCLHSPLINTSQELRNPKFLFSSLNLSTELQVRAFNYLFQYFHRCMSNKSLKHNMNRSALRIPFTSDSPEENTNPSAYLLRLKAVITDSLFFCSLISNPSASSVSLDVESSVNCLHHHPSPICHHPSLGLLQSFLPVSSSLSCPSLQPILYRKPREIT